MEFELQKDGTLRYANNSYYKNDSMIRKQCKLVILSLYDDDDGGGLAIVSMLNLKTMRTGKVSTAVMSEIRRIVRESEIIKYVVDKYVYIYEERKKRKINDRESAFS